MQEDKMQEQLKEVADRIKNMREILGISPETMARNTGVSAEEYAAYEAGEKDFSFTFIYKCAKCFNVDPTDLLKGSSPHADQLCRHQEGRRAADHPREGAGVQKFGGAV